MTYYSGRGPIDPTEHRGIGHPDEWRDGDTCESDTIEYAKQRARVWSGSPLVGIVPGGSKDTADVQYRRDFGPGLDAYKKARDEGLQPDHSDLKSVEAAHQRVKSQEDALRKIKKFSDVDGVVTTPGVNRDVT